jgi:hypothetical protein
MGPTCPTIAHGVGGWRGPFIGPLEPRPARLARVIAILRCLISSRSSPGGSLPRARSAGLGVITEAEKGTYPRIRPNLQARPKLQAP